MYTRIPTTPGGRRYSSPSSPTLSSPTGPMKVPRRWLVVAFGLLVLSAVLYTTAPTSQQKVKASLDFLHLSGGEKVYPKASEGLLRSNSTRHPKSYKDNLLPDRHYITGFQASGWNNQVFELLNLLHLAHLLSTTTTQHIPVLPPFTPHFAHLRSKDAPVLRASQVYDLDRFAATMGWGVVEWHELKDGVPGYDGEGGTWLDEWDNSKPVPDVVDRIKNREKIPVWGIWQQQYKGNKLGLATVKYYDLEPIYTPLPASLFSTSDYSPNHVLLPSIANFLSLPDNNILITYLPKEADSVETSMLGQQILGWKSKDIANKTADEFLGFSNGHWVSPAGGPGQLVAFDLLYFASTHGEEVRSMYKGELGGRGHWNNEFGPWFTVGKHLRFTRERETSAWNLVKSVLGMRSDAANPAILTVHLRHGDLLSNSGCPGYLSPCFDIVYFAHRLKAIRERLRARGHTNVDTYPVLVATDDNSAKMLADLHHLGWHYIDHEKLQTAEKHGPWESTLVDNVVLSLGVGFVGTEDSTMSILAKRRVIDWNQGETALVGMLDRIELDLPADGTEGGLPLAPTGVKKERQGPRRLSP